MISIADVLSFWGKAQPAEWAACGFHPIVYHLLDVAATTDAILEHRTCALARGARLLGIGETEARRLFVALAGLHDLGKFAPKFQAKAEPDGWRWPTALGEFDANRLQGSQHTTDGFSLWFHELRNTVDESLWPRGDRVLHALAPGLFGHHGRPARDADEFGRSSHRMGRPAGKVAIECARLVIALLHPHPLTSPPPDVERARIASWWFAGLLTVSDWVGSNQEWFPYTPADPSDTDFSTYWARARERAETAISKAGLIPPCVAPRRTFTELTGICTPSPAQEWAATVALPDGPLLVVIEDVTGSGKTEVAQMLVHRLMVDGRATGAYWAMPTQATANAMYLRQERAIAALFTTDRDTRPSLALTHGNARLNERFRTTVLGSAGRGPEARSVGPTTDPELVAGAECAAFLAEDRRAAFLADVGAGSVDQALLGVLPTRFNVVRLFGLADKVLVVDEAHAYDSYMRVELQELLRFHAALGGSAVVLSATLSHKNREDLVGAWLEGLDGGRRRMPAVADSAQVRSSSYPLATVAASGSHSFEERPLSAAARSCRDFGIRFIHSADDAIGEIVSACERGAAVTWIRNTVDDCLAAATALREHGLEPIVFHARFARGDRNIREAQVLECFGKDAVTGRSGKVVVATQVIEQSLDLDFDLMVTDLAPVDLLIQRAGRLWRHEGRKRPDGLECELVVLAPRFELEPARTWLTDLLPGTAHVYEDTVILWRTVRMLQAHGRVRVPDDIRGLVEGVYALNEPPPDALSRTADRAFAAAQVGAAAANQQTLKVTDGYTGDAHAWLDDLRATTRSGDQDTVIRLGRVEEGGAILPWFAGVESDWKAWALSEIRVSRRRVPYDATAAPEYAVSIDEVRKRWNRFEREIPVLPLRCGTTGVWMGELACGPKRVQIAYDNERGLAFL